MKAVISTLAASTLFACSAAPLTPPITGPYRARVAAIRTIVDSAAARHGVDANLILGVIHVESTFRANAGSHAGARGLMQLMPRTAASLAKRLGINSYDLEDPRFNIEAGTLYLKYLLRRFSSTALALAAYNAGPARIARLQRSGAGLPRYSRRYVAAVMAARRRFTGALMPKLDDPLDRRGLRALLRQRLYGDRPDERIPLAQANQ